MIRFDVEARLDRVEKQILRHTTQLRPLLHERKNLLALLAKQSIPAPAGSAGKTRKDAHP